MDLMAMRGGILDWRRAAAILSRLDGADGRTRGDRRPPRASRRFSPPTQR